MTMPAISFFIPFVLALSKQYAHDDLYYPHALYYFGTSESDGSVQFMEKYDHSQVYTG